MKANIFTAVIFFSVNLYAQDIFVSDKLEKVWETTDELKTPESVCYDPANNLLYVSNMDRSSSDVSKSGFISKVSLDGKIIELVWVKNLNSPTGMGIYKNNLYVALLDEVVEISIASGKIINTFKVEGAKFLNDITIGLNGEVYISDSDDKSIYLLKDNNIILWIHSDKIDGINGLWFEKERLLAGIAGKVVSIDLKDKSINSFIDNTGGIDGIVAAGNGYYLISDWQGNVQLIFPGKENEKLLSTASVGINAADIDFIPDKGLLFVPTFFDNRVMCYKLK